MVYYNCFVAKVSRKGKYLLNSKNLSPQAIARSPHIDVTSLPRYELIDDDFKCDDECIYRIICDAMPHLYRNYGSITEEQTVGD